MRALKTVAEEISVLQDTELVPFVTDISARDAYACVAVQCARETLDPELRREIARGAVICTVVFDQHFFHAGSGWHLIPCRILKHERICAKIGSNYRFATGGEQKSNDREERPQRDISELKSY